MTAITIRDRTKKNCKRELYCEHFYIQVPLQYKYIVTVHRVLQMRGGGYADENYSESTNQRFRFSLNSGLLNPELLNP